MTYETPEIIELGSVAEFTQGAGTNFQWDGGLDFFSRTDGGSTTS